MELRYISGNVVTGKQLFKKLVKWKALVDTAGIKSADLKDKFDEGLRLEMSAFKLFTVANLRSQVNW